MNRQIYETNNAKGMRIIERLAFIDSSFPAITLPTIFAKPYTSNTALITLYETSPNFQLSNLNPY